MTTNLDTSYMAIQAERNRLDTRAARGWLAAEAATSSTRRPFTATIRHHAGRILVGFGHRLEAAPEPAPANLGLETSH